MIPFGKEKNIGKPYCLPNLTGWIAWPFYVVRNLKAIKKSDLYDIIYLYNIMRLCVNRNNYLCVIYFQWPAFNLI